VTSLFDTAADILDPQIYQPWICWLPECDGMPHEGFEWRHARTKQRWPLGRWFSWFIRAGRGFGKTRTGGEWLIDSMRRNPGTYWGIGARTFDDGRDLCVEGESGLLFICDYHKVKHDWNKSTGVFTLANGSRAELFTSEKPDSWRGPNLTGFWGDEPASWIRPLQVRGNPGCYENLLFMTRKGEPHLVFTGTPKNNRFTKMLQTEADHETLGVTDENRANLADIFYEKVIDPLRGTRLGRQEIDAEIVDDVEGALWKLAQIDAGRLPAPARYARIGIALDPSVSNTEDSDECGLVVAGVDMFKHGFVLEDRSRRMSTRAWAREAVDAYHEWEADVIFAEVNNGGDLVADVIHGLDPSIPVETVHASRGKTRRAEPVANLYGDPDREETWAEARIHHVAGADLAVLESQMCEWTRDETLWSPDRMDALVWDLTGLLIEKPKGRARPTLSL
jgi:phage terminase large subunit-like protein